MKGHISISRFTGSSTGISIELQDDISRVRVVKIELTAEQFGNAISGLSYQDCNFDLGRIDRVGMRAEYKTELILTNGSYHFTPEQKQKLVADYEHDGWKADLADLGNHHKSTKGGYHVGFRRHVPNT